MPSHTDFHYKDRLFKAIFADKERLLSLYNALNGSCYTDVNDMEVTTIDNVIYLGMKNDLSFLIDDEMSLYEQQSSYNPNMPLRGLMYFAELYQTYLTRKRTNVYSSRRVKIPTPKFIVFYNGADKKDVPDVVKFRLSDAFIKEDKSGDFEWTATMLNINKGHNKELLEKSAELSAYSSFVCAVRGYIAAGHEKDKAIDMAIEDAIRDNLLDGFFKEKKMEVMGMSLHEFDQDEYDRIRWEDGYADGKAEGKAEGVAQGKAEGKMEGILFTAKAMLMRRLDCNMVSECTGLSLAEVARLQAAL